jgi:hypothetical protein
LHQLLEAQKAEHDRLKAEGVLCPWVFNRTGKKVKGKRIIRLTTFPPTPILSGLPRRSRGAAKSGTIWAQ